MRSAAEANSVTLIVTDAQSSTPKQVSDIQDMVAQGVDLLFVPPREEEGMAPALESAREANVPVFFVDRQANAEICKQYITFMGSDFVRQGERAAKWARKTGPERGAVLRAVAEKIRESKEELAQLVVAEKGKTITETRGEVGDAAGFFEYYATFECAQIGAMFAPDATNEY
jgi:ABC-type sugar transport system substrate-binding protein